MFYVSVPTSDCIVKNLLSCLERNLFIAVHGISFSLLTSSRTQTLRKNKVKKCFCPNSVTDSVNRDCNCAGFT